MSFRLLASDLDGTLMPLAQSFSPRLQAAVLRAQANGVRVVMATGRMYRSALPFARALGLTGPLICDQGGTIRDVQTDETLFQQTMPLDLARQVLAFVSDDMTVLVCLDEEFYTLRMTPEVVAFVETYRDHLHIVPELAHTLRAAPQKIVFVADALQATRLFNELRSQFGAVLQVVQSHPRFIELTHRDVSKGKAVEWLAARWQIPRDQVLAMGDHDNDRSMIAWAGYGVAMGNAIDEVKAIADFVAPNAEADGAAIVIEKFILNGLPPAAL